ncbi:MAG: division/cell wall cluster transcriptional repressor MraZ [Candidatus Thioglobus sp.]|jgi:MraZ protein|uniref:division/cell wall cluster transcriptional repressor MraZ n=1 Tax=Candidatus Thioglobus sp. TaxID=2026721 RepID=UPI001ECF95CF|nr:division/cell wall cluster transcriptional repressor MraZ [Candidatus Thioglobus sp.]MBT3187238.1 division/cell wall cluster transcriptional repressor MraZ [Candidatus Thioglobus sp.]MBT4315739.1 division/cell wall cluster transcriptional repressor MraZ [Candidatus Thioglobus sp.]MBT4923254.1 division/cell wall cluster transcriptional repressor MraZ [Candidatus Thioglobus sp.]MBT6655195.1 division/cell wall cluster transcriptional repressor MraZ [Candidatus Thioglobus sp.]MBT7412366.1 divis
MFRGVHNLTIDAKGRLKIPTRHQTQIDKTCGGKMVLSIHPDDGCLLLYPLGDWQKLEQKVSELPSLNIHTKRLKRKLIGHATDCELDKASRILIPGTLRDYANLNKKIIMSGQGRNFELWDESTWNKQLTNLDALSKKEVIPIEISQLSL